MIVESVRIYGKPRGSYLCSTEIIISDGPMRFCLKGVRLIDVGREKPLIAMPTWKKEGMDGPIFEEMFHALTIPARQFLEDSVLAQYYAQSNVR